MQTARRFFRTGITKDQQRELRALAAELHGEMLVRLVYESS